MTIVIGIVVVLVVLVVGGLLALAFTGFAKSVHENETAVVTTGKNKSKNGSFNPAMTMGFEIDYEEDAEAQIKEARLLAAKQAATMPRGANIHIGSLGNPTFSPLTKSLEDDPWTAAKIAQHHGWDGARSGFVLGGTVAPVAGTAAPTVTVAPPVLIELTDDMDPAAKRAARLANTKAKSAYKKALKAAGIDPKAVAATPVAAAPVAVPAATAGIEPPVLIELTDDMDPADKRAARLSNTKAKSAYKKALKAAGIDPKAVSAPAPAATPAPVAPAAPAVAPVAAVGIEPPQLIELTDDMEPADKRDARIANSKAKSAYKKALKAAGIDPKSVA